MEFFDDLHLFGDHLQKSQGLGQVAGAVPTVDFATDFGHLEKKFLKNEWIVCWKVQLFESISKKTEIDAILLVLHKNHL